MIAPMPTTPKLTGRSMATRFALVILIAGVFAWLASLLVHAS